MADSDNSDLSEEDKRFLESDLAKDLPASPGFRQMLENQRRAEDIARAAVRGQTLDESKNAAHDDEEIGLPLAASETEEPHDDSGFSGIFGDVGPLNDTTTGIRLPGGQLSPTPREERHARLRAFMSEEMRAAYDGADFEQKQIIWAANEQAFEQAERRKEQKRRRDEKRMAEAMDMLQRVKEDPDKADLLPPENWTIPELLKWHEDMSKPVYTFPPFPISDGVSPQDIAAERKAPVVSEAAKVQPLAIHVQDAITPMADSPQAKQNLWDKIWKLADSNVFMGGGVAMAVAGYGFIFANAPRFGFVLLVLAWIVMSMSIWRHRFFEGRSTASQIMRNLITCGLVGIVLLVVWLLVV